MACPAIDHAMQWARDLRAQDYVPAGTVGGVQAAVQAAARAGGRLMGCAAGYNNQADIGAVLAELIGGRSPIHKKTALGPPSLATRIPPDKKNWTGLGGWTFQADRQSVSVSA